jgi:hypothetical protein
LGEHPGFASATINPAGIGHSLGRISLLAPASATVQTKLSIGRSNDTHEQEADRVAEQIMHMPQPSTAFDGSTARPGVFPTIQGVCTVCEEELPRRPSEEDGEVILRTKPQAGLITPLTQRPGGLRHQSKLPNAQSTVPPTIQCRITALRGNGQPLSRSEREFFEPRFGVDFSRVRIHANQRESEVARAVGARAFTVGSDIFLGRGQYAPQSADGRRLLAHELTHVVQQTRTSRPAVLQREEEAPEDEPPRCENPEEITDEVRNFRIEVIRQIARNPSLRRLNVTLPSVPPPGEEPVEELLRRLQSTAPPPQLISPANANIAQVALEVLSDDSGFAFDTIRFFVCDRINLPELEITPGQRFAGYVDPNQTPLQIYYERRFQNNLQSFLESDDLSALRSALILIAHEKRHVTLKSVPGITASSESLREGAEQDVVNYYIEELLVTAEEIMVDFLSDPGHVVSLDRQHAIRRFWRFIEESVDEPESERVRVVIQNELRSRYGGGNCDNAISTGMLTAMSFGQWYRCGEDGRVARLPDGVTPCPGQDNTHAICRGAVPVGSQTFSPGQLNP